MLTAAWNARGCSSTPRARAEVRWSTARATNPPRRPGTVGSARAFARARAALDHVEVHFGEYCEVYLTPLARDRVNVAVLAHAGAPLGARALVTRALDGHPAAARVVGAFEGAPRARELRAHCDPRSPAARALRCGDAAVAIDPILGAGVGSALESGCAAGSAALRVLGGADPVRVARDHERSLARATRRARVAARLLCALSAHARLAVPVARLLDARPALANACVRFTLGGPRAGFSP
ncbi:MAG: hypothetical protein HZA53_04995 [Planctomycetes bacterium]|nr:hypothetical protein [Planctomycetota bacterium]